MFLSDKELMELTGYKRPGEQRRWLASHNWPFEIAAKDTTESCVRKPEIDC
jgi:hypothetical protein